MLALQLYGKRCNKSGKVHGKWPGLAKNQLYQGRDSAVTADFRDAIAFLLASQLYVERTKIERIFPGYTFSQNIRIT